MDERTRREALRKLEESVDEVGFWPEHLEKQDETTDETNIESTREIRTLPRSGSTTDHRLDGDSSLCVSVAILWSDETC